MKKQVFAFFRMTTLIAGTALWTSLSFANEVNVYSERKEELIRPLLDQFTKDTGIHVNLITGKADALIVRMANEGKFSPADVLITTDVGRLVRAKNQGLTQAFESVLARQKVSPYYQDPEGHWYGLSLRARPLMYAIERVKPETLNDLEDLGSPQWKGKVCVRSSSNIYNQSMVAALLYQLEEKRTADLVKALVNNFARPPMGGDRDQIKAVAAGECDIAIANTYYLAGMLAGNNLKETAAAKKVKVFWPNQNNRGAHVNISGAAIAKYAKNKQHAEALLNFLLSKPAQSWYSETNFEYSVRTDIESSKLLKSFGEFKAEHIPMEKVGELNTNAVKLMDRAGWK